MLPRLPIPLILLSIITLIFSEPLHPAAQEGPQNEVLPSSKFSSRIRSRVFRDATQGGFNAPRLYRASGRFHKRVQSATTHDIQNVPLPSDSVQIVSYKYDAEKHDEKKMANNDLQSITEADASDHAKGIERTTMSVRGETTPLPTTTQPPVPSTTTQMPEQNSIVEKAAASPPRVHFQTVQAGGLQPQPPMVFTQVPPVTIYPAQTPIDSAIPHQPSNPLFPAVQASVVPGALGQGQIGQAQAPVISGTLGQGQLVGQAPVVPTAVAATQGAVHATGTGSENHEQLGCGWDWLTNSCKDVFNLNWCGKCHDFGNIFLHDCKCVVPLIQLPTTSRPQVTQSTVLPAPQRAPQMYFWLI
ncbi:unnamed protein product [Caenorhabditis angaria]|uniref:ShKT domain-containing protein n=1 Tax=Caenorhabditis angaria TaxID=860376 RepID=A0A9P1IYS0_9PELO|nr:unnamed protein product [Caenorhabditis angaria]